jgi:ABC-type dipeptide/oligopeptide/nickel transport system ATPase subunit
MYKGYIGLNKIEDAVVSQYKTPNGAEIIQFTFEDKTTSLVPKVMAEKIVTDEPIDLTTLRDKRMQPICEKILEVLSEYDIKTKEWDYASAIVGGSLLESFNLAEEKLWGTKEKTALDIQRVLDRFGVKAEDIPVDK